MLTKLDYYERFLIDYYNLSGRNNLTEGKTMFQRYYLRLQHDKEIYPNHNGYVVVPTHLVDCFLLWWKEKDMQERKMQIH